MAQIIHLRCRYCGEKLTDGREPYCPPCNLYLCYRAMPILLGMMMTGHLLPAPHHFQHRAGHQEGDRPLGYDDKNALAWE